MAVSSFVLGLAGLMLLFAPQEALAVLRVPLTTQLPVLVQLAGALYVSFSVMNWTAKDSVIGGIYARPISLANFAHFFIGTLLLAKVVLSTQFSVFIVSMLV